MIDRFRSPSWNDPISYWASIATFAGVLIAAVQAWQARSAATAAKRAAEEASRRFRALVLLERLAAVRTQCRSVQDVLKLPFSKNERLIRLDERVASLFALMQSIAATLSRADNPWLKLAGSLNQEAERVDEGADAAEKPLRSVLDRIGELAAKTSAEIERQLENEHGDA